MLKVQETNEELIFINTISTGLRIFLFFVGWIPAILAPYELLIRPRWNGVSLFMIIPILIAVSAVAVGGLCIGAGLLGLNQTLRFHLKKKTIHYAYESPLTHLGKKTFTFSELAKCEIKEHDWSDGPPSYGMRFIFLDDQKIDMGSFEKKAEAEQYLNKVETLMR